MGAIEKCYQAYKTAADIIKSGFGMRSISQIPTPSSLLPVVSHLIRKTDAGQKIDDKTCKDITEWLFLVNFTGYYSSHRDSKLQEDIETARNIQFPFDGLLLNISNNRGVRNIDSQHIREDFSKYHALKDEGLGNLLLIYVAEHKNGADDWNGHSLSERDYSALERHHIFPKNYLIKMINNGGFADSEADEEGEELFINTAANITFVDQYINESISDSAPEEYLPKYLDSAVLHFISKDANLWKFENYEDFLTERIKLIYSHIKMAFPRIFSEYKPPLKRLSKDSEIKTNPPALEMNPLYKKLETDVKKIGIDILIKPRKRGYIKFKRDGHKHGFLWVTPKGDGLQIDLNPKDDPAPVWVNVKNRNGESWRWQFMLNESNYDNALTMIKEGYLATS
jgi:hypothetical protein